MVKAVAVPHKNNRLFQLLLDQIKSGKLSVGARLPSERELASLYHCSRATVRSSLEQLENQNYVCRQQGSGTYVLNHEESSSRKLKTIAVIHNTQKEDISNDPYLGQIFMGLQDACSELSCNFNLIKLNMDEKLLEVLARKKIDPRSFDGYLSLGYPLGDQEIDLFHDLKIPFASCVPARNNRPISYVTIDNCSAAYIAAAHLLSLGRRNLFLLNGPSDDKHSPLKEKGFRKALEEYGVNFSTEMARFAIPDEDKAAFREVTDILESVEEKKRPDALLVYGDWATYGTINAIRNHGLRVPEDIAIVMIDDYQWVSRALGLQITAVRQPFQEQATRALALLLQQMESCDTTVNIVEILQPQLIIRKSCGIALG